MRRAMLLVLAAACGGGSPSPEEAAQPLRTTAPAISLAAPRASADDVEVARVDGRPIWGSCVTAQVARGAATREAALDECIQFELLARAAEQRGLAADPMVADATRRALVSREIALHFEDRTQTPAALGDRMTKWLAENSWRMHRPDLRASSYARINVPKDSSPEVEAEAKALADKIAAALRGETGLFPADVKATAQRIVMGSKLVLDATEANAMPRENMDVPYGDALYAIPEVGRVGGPVRTRWGWDVILWTGGLPPREFTQDQIAAEVYPELRRAAFQAWVNDLVRALGVRIHVEPELLTRLQEST